MMVTHKIIDDFYEDSFTLLAVHSSMEDYALVYALNLCLKTKFKRVAKDLDISDSISFPIFEWKDDITDSYWTLIVNKCYQEDDSLKNGLFENVPSIIEHHLVPEYKEADYFLKIEHDNSNLEKDILNLLLTIPKIITAYILDVDQLKSKSNLIF